MLIILYLELRIANVKDVAGIQPKWSAKKQHIIWRSRWRFSTPSTDVSTRWASPNKPVLSHVIYSPPIELSSGTIPPPLSEILLPRTSTPGDCTAWRQQKSTPQAQKVMRLTPWVAKTYPIFADKILAD